MIRIENKAFEKLSFHDERVQKFEFLKNEKVLKVYVSGAWDGGKQLYLDDGYIVFKDWSSLTVLRYDSQAENSVVLQEHEFDIPREMDVFEEEPNRLMFGGFGTKDHRLVEWIIIGSNYYAEFTGYNPTNYV